MAPLSKELIVDASFLSVLSSLSTAIAALAAAAAALFTYMYTRSADATLRSQLFLAFSDRYSEPAMSEAIIKLMKWRQAHPTDFAEVWFARYQAGDDEALELEKARRALNRYFVDIGRLYESKQVDEKLAYVLLGHFGLDVYYEVCHPMWKKVYPAGYRDYTSLLKTIRPHYGDDGLQPSL
jgi:hypothetical protein